MVLHAGCRAYDNVKAAGNVAGLSGAAPGSCVLEVSNITNIALAFGFTIFVLVYATAAYTGQPCGTPITIGSCKSLRILDFQNIANIAVGHDPRPLASAPCNIPPASRLPWASMMQ